MVMTVPVPTQFESVAQAQAVLMAYPSAAVTATVESVTLTQACGRVAARAISANIDIPPQDNSAMDGIAINSADFTQPGTRLRISQRVPAGHDPAPLQRGTAARIFTGGVIPAGADCVVMQENCQFQHDPANDTVTVQIQNSPKPGDNIRPRGQDIQRGAQVIAAGQVLSPIDLSLIGSLGQASVAVKARLKIAIFSTGDELVEPGRPLRTGQIYNSNRILLQLMCEQLGAEIVDLGVVNDTLYAAKTALRDAAQCADLIISSGGVSVGEEDHIRPAVAELGELQFWKVPMKPGKPVALGRVDNCAFLGLPGNPVSSFVVFQLLGVPLIRALQGGHIALLKPLAMRAHFAKAAVSREEYIRVRKVQLASGEYALEPFGNASSGVLSSIAWADGLVRQAPDHAICSGDLVEFLPMRNSSIW